MITSARYTATEQNSIKVTYESGEELNVPVAVGNRHYIELQEWVNGGGSITDFSYTIDELKDQKRNEIRTAFDTEATTPVVVNVNSVDIEFHGGYDSTQRLDAATRLAEQSSLTDIELFDMSNIGYTLVIAEAKIVTSTLGAKYQADFSKKQYLMVDIDMAVDQAGLNLIAW